MSIDAKEIIELVELIEPQYREACRKAEDRIARDIDKLWRDFVLTQSYARRRVKRARKYQKQYGERFVLTGVFVFLRGLKCRLL